MSGQGIGDPFGEAAGYVGLGGARPVFGPVRGDEMDLIVLAAHSAGDVVGDDPVAALAVALRFRGGDDLVRLRGEADEEARALGVAREAGAIRDRAGLFS